jgi:hypothetical protein
MRLTGRTAIVTGAGFGIGRASAVLIANEGAFVALVDRDGAGLQETLAAIEGAKGEASVHVGDVSEADFAQTVVGNVMARRGRLDVLMTAAGFSCGGTVLTTDPADWDAVFRTNVGGTWLWSRAAVPEMQRQGRGSIISRIATRDRRRQEQQRLYRRQGCDHQPDSDHGEPTFTALLIALVSAVPLGVLAALKPGSAIDHGVRFFCALGVCVPTFVSGLLLIYVFYYLFGLAPDPTGRVDIFASLPPSRTGFLLIDFLLAGDFAGWRAAFRQLILPAQHGAVVVCCWRAHSGPDAGFACSDFACTANHRPSRKIVVTRTAQRHPAGHHHRGHRVLDHARRECSGGEGVLLAGRRLLCARCAALFRLCTRAGFRVADGQRVCDRQPAGGYPLWHRRSQVDNRMISATFRHAG